MSPEASAGGNLDAAELEKFDRLAERWWDPRGEMRPLHAMNAARLAFIERHAPLAGLRVLDVGCGGGILSESLARAGARVTGIDMAAATLAVARRHAAEGGLAIDYVESTAERWAEQHPGAYDALTCMELLEHVPDPGSLIRACHELLRPGAAAFFSTVNRNLKSFLFAIVSAEYLLRLLPTGTHHFERFIRPSELDIWARHAGLETIAVEGIRFEPLGASFALGGAPDVNYLACCRRPAD